MKKLKTYAAMTVVLATLGVIAGSSSARNALAEVHRIILVHDVDNPALQPFTAAGLNTAIIGVGSGTITTVPQGKRLVIEYVSAQLNVAPGDRAVLSIITTESQYIPLTRQGTFNGQDFLVAGQTTRIYADPGTNVDFTAVVNSNSSAQATVIISGYYVNLP